MKKLKNKNKRSTNNRNRSKQRNNQYPYILRRGKILDKKEKRKISYVQSEHRKNIAEDKRSITKNVHAEKHE